MPHRRPFPLLAAALSLVLVACGGGGSGGEAPTASATGAGTSPPPTTSPNAGTPDPGDPSTSSAPDAAQRLRAASETANNSDACQAVRPFYWEIGDADGQLAAGSIGRTSAGRAVTAGTQMRFASATKWLYAGYVAQRRNGRFQSMDEHMLTLRSGYTHFAGCASGQTVDGCLAWQDNDQYEADADGRFFYGGAHLQKHASLMGLGALDAPGLAAAMREALGGDVAIGMAQARPAGGATGTPSAYAAFLRKLARGELALGRSLGAAAVCASPQRCPAGEALSGPAPAQEVWHYSLGHWVENDPVTGDGAFSSPGAFGFYPWVAANRKLYGMLARDVGTTLADDEQEGAGIASARCGRLIRRAWVSGVVQ